jgi:hypothetical protein
MSTRGTPNCIVRAVRPYSGEAELCDQLLHQLTAMAFRHRLAMWKYGTCQEVQRLFGLPPCHIATVEATKPPSCYGKVLLPGAAC